MARRYGDHVWISGDGPRGARGARADRCSRCGLFRRKANGAREYWFTGTSHVEAKSLESVRCDPSKLQRQLDLGADAGRASLRSKGRAADPARAPSRSRR